MQTVEKRSDLHRCHSPPCRQAGRQPDRLGYAIIGTCFNNFSEGAAPSHSLKVIGRDGNLFRICQHFRIGFEEAKVRVVLEAAVWMGFILTVDAPRHK